MTGFLYVVFLLFGLFIIFYVFPLIKEIVPTNYYFMTEKNHFCGIMTISITLHSLSNSSSF